MNYRNGCDWETDDKFEDIRTMILEAIKEIIVTDISNFGRIISMDFSHENLWVIYAEDQNKLEYRFDIGECYDRYVKESIEYDYIINGNTNIAELVSDGVVMMIEHVIVAFDLQTTII